MSLVRPEVRATFHRWREMAVALAVTVVGLWLVLRGGLFYGALGGITVAIGASLALTAWRRLRFLRPVAAIGAVEVLEGQVSYFGPAAGGMIAMSDLVRIEVLEHRGELAWRLVPDDTSPLTIPTAAHGADTLFDVFAALPGARAETFVAAMSGPLPEAPQVLWRRAPPHRTTSATRP